MFVTFSFVDIAVIFLYRALLTDLQTRVSGLGSGGHKSGIADSAEIMKQLQDVKVHFAGVQGDVKSLLLKPQVHIGYRCSHVSCFNLQDFKSLQDAV